MRIGSLFLECRNRKLFAVHLPDVAYVHHFAGVPFLQEGMTQEDPVFIYTVYTVHKHDTHCIQKQIDTCDRALRHMCPSCQGSFIS